MNYDVLVLGGGAAGLAAAVTAARQGARVVLVERHGSLGGTATTALVHTVCGLYRLHSGSAALPAHPGLPAEFAERLLACGAAAAPQRLGRLDVLPHSPPGFALVADALVSSCPSLELRLHTELIGVSIGGSAIAAVELHCRGRRTTLEPRAAVDASGDAELAALAGADLLQRPAARLQRPAFIFALQGVDVLQLDADGRIRAAALIAAAVGAGSLDPGLLGSQLRPSGRGAEVYVTLDLEGPPDYDPLAPAQLTALELRGRRLAAALLDFLRQHHPACGRAEIAAFPARVGVRESRNVLGRALVTGDDVLRGSPQPDVVALGTWPMELRERATGPRWRFPEELRPTQIPLGALRASRLDNLWTAGRCLSCDHEAQAALRVIGTCLASGQAAGAAAALQAAAGTAPDAAAVRRCTGLEVPH